MSYYINRIKGIIYSKLGTNVFLRGVMQKIASIFIPNEDIIGNEDYFTLSNIETHKKNLKSKGITYLGNILKEEIIEKITEDLEKLKCHDTWAPELGEFNVANVTKQTHTASFKREELVKNDIIFNIANNKYILEIVKDYLGVTPTISNVNAWWSFGGRDHAQEAQNFHRDNDDIKFCKLFIYLTDVTENSGPHVYVENTVNSSKLRKIIRYTDKEVVDSFGEENIKELIYSKGHAFIEDTYGIHKGTLPKTENRLLLQIQYSVSPIGYIKYNPIMRDSKESYSSYVNRLIVK